MFLSEGNMFLSDKGPTLETLDFTIHISSTPTFLYFDLVYDVFMINTSLGKASLILKDSLSPFYSS